MINNIFKKLMQIYVQTNSKTLTFIDKHPIIYDIIKIEMVQRAVEREY